MYPHSNEDLFVAGKYTSKEVHDGLGNFFFHQNRSCANSWICENLYVFIHTFYC